MGCARVRLLPILWGHEPTTDDWKRLSRAREAIGHQEMLRPARAVKGSPGRILAFGTNPDWLTPYQFLDSTTDPRLEDALRWCLDESIEDPDAPTYEDMIVAWSHGELKYVGEEPIDG